MSTWNVLTGMVLEFPLAVGAGFMAGAAGTLIVWLVTATYTDLRP